MQPEFAPSTEDALPFWPVWQGDALPEEAGAGTWPAACGFSGKPGQICLLPGEAGTVRGALSFALLMEPWVP